MPSKKDQEDLLAQLNYEDNESEANRLMNIPMSIVLGDYEKYKENVVSDNEMKIREDFAELSTKKDKFIIDLLKYKYAKATADRNAELHNKKYGDIIIKTSAGDNNKELELIKLIGRKYPEESLFSYIQNNLFERNIESIEDLKPTDNPMNTGDVIVTKEGKYFVLNLDGTIMAMKTDKDDGIMVVGANRIPRPWDGYTYD